MIVDFLVNALVATLTTIFSVMPDIPPIPSEFTAPLNYFYNVIKSASYVMTRIYGTGLLVAIVTALVVLLNFERVYHLALYIIRKIPLNIK